MICGKVGQVGFNRLLNFGGQNVGGSVLSLTRKIIGGAVEGRYCNALGSGSTPASDALWGHMQDANNAITDRDNVERQLVGDSLLKTVDLSIDVGGGGFDGFGTISYGSNGGNFDPGFDTWWGKDGPLVPWQGTYNGAIWQQVYGINIAPDYKDRNEPTIGIASKQLGLAQTADPGTYLAQAEYYFDCDGRWSDDMCNGDATTDANAGFAIKWRARLRHVDLPDVGALLQSYGYSFVTGLSAWQNLKNDVTGGAKSIGTKANEICGAVCKYTPRDYLNIGQRIMDKTNDVVSRPSIELNTDLGKGGVALDNAIGYPKIYH
jgi:hypothetical protein